MEKIGIIINPHAKKNQKIKLNRVELYKKIGSHHVDIRVTDSLDDIYRVAEDFKKKKISYLGISGGDGTLHHIISRFLYIYKSEDIPPIVLLKDGTMNTISRTIHLKGKGTQILSKLLKTLNDKKDIKVLKRDTIKIDDKYCFLFGLGLAPNFLAKYYEGGDTGPGKAIKVLGKAVLGSMIGINVGNLFDRFNARLIVDDKELWFYDFFGIIAATVEEIGISFKSLFRAYEKTGTHAGRLLSAK